MIEVAGADEVAGALIGRLVAKSAALARGGRRAEKVAQEMVEAARAAAPVDTGALRDSIGYRREGDHFVIEADVETENDVFYARFVEFGTRAGPRRRKRADGTRTTVDHPGTEPNPFFYEPIRALAEAYRLAVIQDMAEAE